jgi:hypothetical protein
MSSIRIDKLDQINTLRGNPIVKKSPLEFALLDNAGIEHLRLLCPYCRCLFASYSDRADHVEAWHRDEVNPE